MHHHPLDPTTHTVEMAQVAEINRRLSAGAAVSAVDLGLTGSGRLIELTWCGVPVFPDIYAHFEGQSEPVLLHTRALRRLSKALHLRHIWGVTAGPVNPPGD